MNVRFRLSAVVVVFFILITGSAYGQHIFQMQAYGKPIEILSQDVFEARFGNNPHIPTSEEAIIALAERLYPPFAKKAAPAVPADREDWCGEEDVGVLFAALQNPEISDGTRRIVNDIIAAAIPPLPRSKVSDSGHFEIWYTSNNTNRLHNVTAAEIDKLATILDSYWDLYARAREPKHIIVDGNKRIIVKVYDIGGVTRKNKLGRTSSNWDHIELNSYLCVKNACKRRSTSAHELFHRLQYAYGYVSGTANMKWIVEGTAVWSQKLTNLGLRDYMYWMNTGLAFPDKDLITARKYDAAHFWVYLQELEESAIGDVWAAYELNGNDAKAAVDSVTRDILGLNFDEYVGMWSSANYIKDLKNAAGGFFAYDENKESKISCEKEYGPLEKVPKTTKRFYPGSRYAFSGSVTPYGADYFVFTPIQTSEGAVAVSLEGTGSFMVSVIGVKNKFYTYVSWGEVIGPGDTVYTVADWNRLVVVVIGAATGGNYVLRVRDWKMK